MNFACEFHDLTVTVDPQPARRIGSIDDYDPMNERFGSTGQGYRPTSSGYGSQQWEETVPEPRSAGISTILMILLPHEGFDSLRTS